MGRSAKESKSLVFEIVFIPSSILSTAGHEKTRREPSVTQAKVLAETYGMPFDSIIFFRASNNLELINEGTE